MHAVMAQSWNVLAGFSGQISLGHAIFYGIGAYATAYFYVKLKTITPIIIREFLLKYQSGSFLASNNFSEILLIILITLRFCSLFICGDCTTTRNFWKILK